MVFNFEKWLRVGRYTQRPPLATGFGSQSKVPSVMSPRTGSAGRRGDANDGSGSKFTLTFLVSTLVWLKPGDATEEVGEQRE